MSLQEHRAGNTRDTGNNGTHQILMIRQIANEPHELAVWHARALDLAQRQRHGKYRPVLALALKLCLGKYRKYVCVRMHAIYTYIYM